MLGLPHPIMAGKMIENEEEEQNIRKMVEYIYANVAKAI